MTSPYTVLDLYEEFDLDHRLMKIDEEWPGAVILLHKIGRLPPVSVNRLHQVTWYVVVIVTWSDSPPDPSDFSCSRHLWRDFVVYPIYCDSILMLMNK